MTAPLHQAFEIRKALLDLEDTLIENAEQLFRRGLKPGTVTASQMNALSTMIYLGTALPKTTGEVKRFLDKQCDKLRKREERTGRAESWLTTVEAGAGGGKIPLGQAVAEWVSEARYLPEDKRTEDPVMGLAALKRCWGHVHALYDYQAAFGEGMCLRLKRKES